MSNMAHLIILKDKAAIIGKLVEQLESFVSTTAAASHGASSTTEAPRIRVGLAGGSVIPMLAEALRISSESGKSLLLERWQVWFVDERVVPLNHADSNYGAFMSAVYASPAWIPKTPESIFAVKTHEGVDEAAANYEGRLKAEFSTSRSSSGSSSATNSSSSTPSSSPMYPSFDLLILGMGEDGHVASLFPHHAPEPREGAFVVPIRDSPKPPSERITMTMPLLQAAKKIIYLAAGAGKVDAMEHIFSKATAAEAQLPAGKAASLAGETIWLVDEAAAAKVVRH